jgi:hypothetical protein
LRSRKHNTYASATAAPIPKWKAETVRPLLHRFERRNSMTKRPTPPAASKEGHRRPASHSLMPHCGQAGTYEETAVL